MCLSGHKKCLLPVFSEVFLEKIYELFVETSKTVHYIWVSILIGYL